MFAPLGLPSALRSTSTINLHFIFDSWGPDASSGVYRVEGDGSLTLVLQIPAGLWPNGLAFRGDEIYVSDSTLGAIWRKAPGDSIAPTTPWYQDPIIAPPTLYDVGANGIAFYQGSLYIAVAQASKNLKKGSIVRLPIMNDGSPGTAGYLAKPDPKLCLIDGIAFDNTGTLWFAADSNRNTNPRIGGRLGTVGQDGKIRIIWDDAAWLDYTDMVAFGTTTDTIGTLFVSNGGMLTGRPDVVSVFVGVPGLPIPAQ
jgi:sugar lactone lactonase YvrE